MRPSVLVQSMPGCLVFVFFCASFGHPFGTPCRALRGPVRGRILPSRRAVADSDILSAKHARRRKEAYPPTIARRNLSPSRAHCGADVSAAKLHTFDVHKGERGCSAVCASGWSSCQCSHCCSCSCALDKADLLAARLESTAPAVVLKLEPQDRAVLLDV